MRHLCASCEWIPRTSTGHAHLVHRIGGHRRMRHDRNTEEHDGRAHSSARSTHVGPRTSPAALARQETTRVREHGPAVPAGSRDPDRDGPIRHPAAGAPGGRLARGRAASPARIGPGGARKARSRPPAAGTCRTHRGQRSTSTNQSTAGRVRRNRSTTRSTARAEVASSALSVGGITTSDENRSRRSRS